MGPGVVQYTLILHASKALPKQCVDFLSGKVKLRRTVGVRLPGDPICQVPTRLSIARRISKYGLNYGGDISIQ